MTWMTDSFSPKVNKIAKNSWIASIQDAILTSMPLVFIGSFATIFSIIHDYWQQFSDLSLISTFSFGLFSLFLAFLIPQSVMKHKKHTDVEKQAGLAGVAFFLLVISPRISETGIISFDLNLFGTGGMIVALIAGLFVSMVMNLFSKWKLIGEESAIPDFVAVWFNTLIPITLILLIGWLFTFQLGINISEVINQLFEPLIHLGGGFWGFVMINFLAFSFLYTFGISSWVLYPVQIAITLPAIAQNQQSVANGGTAAFIYTSEAVNLFLVGGGGATLSLCLMLAFMAKSPRLRMIGKASIVPSIFNINEPIVFSAPIAFNPILMVPMWINGLVGPVVVWCALKFGLVPIPYQPFQLWYVPTIIQGWIMTRALSGLLLVIVIFAISWIVYFPFFKVYDKQAVIQDQELMEEEADEKK